VVSVQHELPPRFDPLDPAVRDDPYPAYTRLRAAGALCRGGVGQWAVARYAEVAKLLADPRLASELPPEYHRAAAGDGPTARFLQRIVLHRDRPAHTHLRRLVGRALGRDLERRLPERIGRLVDELLEPAVDRGRLDFAAELALPLPVLVICELLGVPAADRHAIRARAHALARAFSIRVEAVHRREADEAVTWLRDYVGALLDDRHARSAGGLVSQSELGLTADGPGRADLVDNVVFLFFAGYETTTSMLATGCAALLDHPDELARLRADPSLVTSAVEECLRYDAPIQSRLRLVSTPIAIDGRIVRPGRLLLLLIGSANRDERRFPGPDRLDLGRRPNPHLSFGGGIHSCAGATLARLEGAVVFGRLLARFGRIEAAGEPERDLESPFRTYARLPVAVGGARRRS
jgi:cytochrome P450